MFAKAIKQTRRSRFSLSELIRLAENFKEDLPLIKRWKNLHGHQLPKTATTNQWAEQFSQVLQNLAWPGYRALTSVEYQASQRWLSLLDEFATLNRVTTQLNFKAALQLLKQLAYKQLFQPESGATRIHVLGLLEAVGMPFDFAWVMGMDNAHWPSQATPSPFISLSLQQTLAMPHCSAQRELHFCQTITKQLLATNRVIHFSYAQQHEGEHYTLSPLLNHLTIIPLNRFNEEIVTPLIKEQIDDHQGPAILPGEKVRGGTGIIKQQAACPFRAFANYRLKAQVAEEPEVGIDARSKGILLHKTLELFWSQVKSQQQLAQLQEEQLETLLQTCIKQACNTCQTNSNNQALLELEKQRLLKLVLRWLKLELQRESFKVIANEQWQHVSLGKLNLHVQIDRIDQLNNGLHILVDYKTGLANPNDWFGYRPNEPQLPLYTCTHKYPVGGMAFAQLRTSELRFKGVTVEGVTLPGCTSLNKVKTAASSDWSEQIKQWQQELNRLANDFMAGNANVDPKNQHQTCQHCQLKALCRVGENLSS